MIDATNGACPILLARVAALAGRLRQAEASLQAVRKLNHALYDAVRVRFETIMGVQSERLDKLCQQLASVRPPDNGWTQLQEIDSACRPIFAECLDFLGGALVRSAGLDQKVCVVADALLAELSYWTDLRWPRFTLLSTDEAYTTLTDVIRLRFADLSIWSLPVAAHEFGHYVETTTRELRFPYLFGDLLRQEGQVATEQNIRYLQEQFADLYAAYVAGPAFACTALLLAFDPLTADADQAEHPSSARRAYMILGALERIAPLEYAGIAGLLRRAWQQALAAAGQPAPFGPVPDPEKIAATLDRQIEAMLAMITEQFGQARYQGWGHAISLQASLASHHTPGGLSSGRDGDDLATIRDVLNAAWLWRWTAGDLTGTPVDDEAIERVGRHALDFCLDVASKEEPK